LIQTRFRKSLEPSINLNPDGPRRKTLKAAGTLVIGLSGGTSSITVLDLVAKTYFAPPSTDDGPGEGEILKGGKEHPRNSADKGVWKGKAAVCYVEVCGAFPEVRFFSFLLGQVLMNNAFFTVYPAKRSNKGNSVYCRKLCWITF
jgi:cytoplasmic tRNA 2-thiolation protein 2